MPRLMVKFLRSLLLRISKMTISICIGIGIIVSASIMRQVMSFIKAHTGERGFIVLMGLTLVILGLAFLIFVIRKSSDFIKTSMFIMILITGLALAWQIKIPQERIHIFEYAILGWFALRDLIKTNKKLKGAILACIFAAVVGILDETFQWILPYRVFDLRDIAFNVLGGVWGVVLYFLS